MKLPDRDDPDGAPDRLAARLRAMPDPPVPNGLEARLLSCLNAEVHPPRAARRRVRWAVAAGGVIAAGVAGLVHGPRPPGDLPDESPPSASGPVAPSAVPAVARGSGPETETPDLPGFRWPIQERSPLTASIAAVGQMLDFQ